MSLITEFHGWLTIRYTFENSEEALLLEEKKLPFLIKELEEQIESEYFAHTKLTVCKLIDEYHLSVSGFSWYYDECSRVIELFKIIAKKAVGTYGLLYVNTEEENEFKIYRVCRGEVTQHRDSLLSPLIPVVEDIAAESTAHY